MILTSPFDSVARHEVHQARVEDCIDVVAVRAACMGTPVVLSALESGIVVTLCDILDLDQGTVAQGLDVHLRTLQRRIKERREQVLSPRHLQMAADAVREPVEALVQAVAEGDGPAVAAILRAYDRVELVQLVLVLASLARRPSCAGEVPDAC